MEVVFPSIGVLLGSRGEAYAVDSRNDERLALLASEADKRRKIRAAEMKWVLVTREVVMRQL